MSNDDDYSVQSNLTDFPEYATNTILEDEEESEATDITLEVEIKPAELVPAQKTAEKQSSGDARIEFMDPLGINNHFIFFIMISGILFHYTSEHTITMDLDLLVFISFGLFCFGMQAAMLLSGSKEAELSHLKKPESIDYHK